MTRQEAIETIKKHIKHWQRLLKDNVCTVEEGNETIEAFTMAIEALEPKEKIKMCKYSDHECRECGYCSDRNG